MRKSFMSYARAQKLRDSEGSGVQWLVCNEWGLANERLLLLSEIDSASGDTRVFRELKIVRMSRGQSSMVEK